MDNGKSELRWGVAQRLEFIEFRLFWEGRVNRSDLMEQFGLSVNQASADLNRYIGFAPDNMVYDKSARTYVRGPDYAAEFLKPDASRYLAQLRSLADGIMDSDDTWIAELPSYDAAPTPARGVNPFTLRSVVGAIRRSEAIEVKYQSLSRPEPSWRWIAPHAIGFDGFRWHLFVNGFFLTLCACLRLDARVRNFFRLHFLLFCRNRFIFKLFWFCLFFRNICNLRCRPGICGR